MSSFCLFPYAHSATGWSGFTSGKFTSKRPKGWRLFQPPQTIHPSNCLQLPGERLRKLPDTHAHPGH